ncbi:MAG: hypothetical protein ACRES2_07315, partial [Steroidobacteraceae bacterium]
MEFKARKYMDTRHRGSYSPRGDERRDTTASQARQLDSNQLGEKTLSSNQSIQRAIWAVLGTTTAIAGLAPRVLAADSATSASGLEEIVVTAQRRSENIQDVPIT